MVDRAALEMPCPERDPGFESLALRQRATHPAPGMVRVRCFIYFMLGSGAYNLSIEIRPYSDVDMDQMLPIWNEVVTEGIAFPQTECLTKKAGETYFRGQSFTGVAVNSVNGRVVGIYTLHPNNVGRCGHICNASYAVSRDARGQGVGERMVRHCLQTAKELGFRILQFNAVVRTNDAALCLYKKLGFTQLGIIPGGFRLDGERYEDIIPHYIVL